jgi:hypothetical protein
MFEVAIGIVATNYSAIFSLIVLYKINFTSDLQPLSIISRLFRPSSTNRTCCVIT